MFKYNLRIWILILVKGSFYKSHYKTNANKILGTIYPKKTHYDISKCDTSRLENSIFTIIQVKKLCLYLKIVIIIVNNTKKNAFGCK